MRRVLLVYAGLSLVILAQVVPLAMIVLNTRTAQPGRLPEGWQIKVNHGTPDISTIARPEGTVIHLKSRKSSFALERSIDIDPNQFPFLTWQWSVSQLPNGGDFRRSATDDQAAQVLVAFPDRRVLSYIWDSTAPKGTMQSASSVPLVHVFAVVCRSGSSELNQWLSETRNLVEDFQKAYGRRPTQVKGIRLQINSQHTGSFAESYFGDVSFHSAPQ